MGRRLASIHDLVTAFPCFEKAGGAFEAKDLPGALPLLAKPVVKIGATGDPSMLQSPMAFVPSLCLPPALAIWGAICKQVGNIFGKGGLVVFGDEHIGASTALHLRTQLGALVCMASRVTIRPLTSDGVIKGLSATLLILLLTDVALPEHRAGRHVIATEQMNRIGLFAGGSQGFAINGKLAMIE